MDVYRRHWQDPEECDTPDPRTHSIRLRHDRKYWSGTFRVSKWGWCKISCHVSCRVQVPLPFIWDWEQPFTVSNLLVHPGVYNDSSQNLLRFMVSGGRSVSSFYVSTWGSSGCCSPTPNSRSIPTWRTHVKEFMSGNACQGTLEFSIFDFFFLIDGIVCGLRVTTSFMSYWRYLWGFFFLLSSLCLQ